MEMCRRLARWTATHPRRLAIDSPRGSYTYQDLADAVDQVTRRLRQLQFAPGDPVVILASDPPSVVCAILAAIESGVVFVPLDITTPAARLTAILTELCPAAQLVDQAGAAALRAARCDAAVLRLDQLLADRSGPRDPTPAHPGAGSAHSGYVYYTSGSTGTPKGIAGQLRSVDHFVAWEIGLLGLGPGARVSQLTSPAFDAFLRDMFVPLASGGTLCVPPDPQLVRDGDELIGWLDTAQVTVVHCVPSVFRTLLAAGTRPPLRSLRAVLLAGEVLTRQDVRRWWESYGDRVRLVNLYGPSETTMTKLYHVVDATDLRRRSVPIGRPMPGARVILLDPAGGVCPPGTVGEICLRTPYRAHGYFRRPDLTAEVFVPNPLRDDPTDIIYRTGDLGRQLAQGELEFIGRRDGQVKVRGVRVEVSEVEAALRQHPAVQDVAVVGRDDRTGSTRLVAYLIPVERQPDPGELRAAAARLLPPALVPSAFIPVESLPRTITGKIDRAALPDLGDLPTCTKPGGDPPQGEVEQTIARIWQEVLGVAQVGRHDNFFEVGGHSLLAIQVTSRIAAALAVELPLRELFEHSTVAQLAAWIGSAGGARSSAVEPIPVTDRTHPVPLSFSQEWLCAHHPVPVHDPYHTVVVGVSVFGELDQSALAAALSDVVRRHEALRTRIGSGPAGLRQMVAADGEWPLAVSDFRHDEPAVGRRRLRELVAAESARPFQLADGPLVRAHLAQLAPGESALLLAMHHLVTDNWSYGVLIKELGQLYDARSREQEPELPGLVVQYPDFAVWQRRRHANGDLAEQLDYWRRQLADLPAAPQFVARGLPAEPATDADRSFQIGSGLSAELTRLGQREGATLFMVLLAVFNVLLSGFTASQDIVVGAPTAGRTRPETQHLIGYFVNTLALRTDLSGRPTFRQLLARVRQTTLDGFSNQDVPRQMVRDEITGGQDPFRVAFNLLNAPLPAMELRGVQLAPLALGGDYAFSHVLPGLEPAALELALIMREDGPELAGKWLPGERMDPLVLGALIRQWPNLLARVVAAPDTGIVDLCRQLVSGPESTLLTPGRA